MKTRIITLFFITSLGFVINAQNLSLTELARNAKFLKDVEEFNDGKRKIKYTDIRGIPYYTKEFQEAKIDNNDHTFKVRYNSFLDAIEILEGKDVYEINKTQSVGDIYFTATKEKLVTATTNDDNSGYFFEIVGGKNRLLKKVKTKYTPEIPAPNSLVPATQARFDLLKPIYYILLENGTAIKIDKHEDAALRALSEDKKSTAKDFIKANKIKFSKEEDLAKFVNFLNQ